MDSAHNEVYDLLLLVDATFSMSNYLEALQTSLPKIIQISQLTDCFSRIGLLAYRDYSEDSRQKDGLLEWSGWLGDKESGITSESLMNKARQLEPIGGGDYPEATKTGLAKAYQLMRADATTIVLLYTDAPPHISVDGNLRDRGSNQNRERGNLIGNKPCHLYRLKSPEFSDWVSAANALRTGDKKAHVFSFLDQSLASHKVYSGYYSYLSAITHGACFHMTRSDSGSIAEATVDVLLAWMGAEKAGSASVELPAELVRYINGQTIRKLKDETDMAANDYFWANGPRYAVESQIKKNVAQVKVTSDLLRNHLPKKHTSVKNFAERYKTDASYRQFATQQISKLIESDVTAISLNPVFGSLWRAVCNDRENPDRDELLNNFSRNVDKIGDADEKARMKTWLEESYDYAAEIAELVESIPQEDRFPCVFLDPTLRHSQNDNRAITEFTRDELLEIGRSCDYRILRRLGTVLTQLTYVQKAEDLPEHIASADVPRIPLCLAQKQHGFKFFRILLHIVLPGTMLGARASAVLAALALRMGMKPLFGPASELMLSWKDRWNDISVPETWNTSCLSLLIDADNVWHEQHENHLLLDKDRKLFEKLVAYKLTEANLLTVLTAKIGWTPEKSQMAVGPLVVCRGCNYPRSVTIMAEKSGGLCGICASTDFASNDVKQRYTHQNVESNADSESSATWVECSSRACRAQYVVYNPAELRVRPKCFYCRQQGKAPWVECVTCLNRMVWPKEFREHQTKTDQNEPFKCVACSHGRQSVVDFETSASGLIKENGDGWLLRNENGALQEPFNKRSLFHTASTTSDLERFAENVVILPEFGTKKTLTIKGKTVQNLPDVRGQLQSWIDRRQAEAVPCSLCFSDFHHTKLRDACGRRGCNQRICEGCLTSWYGVNQPGHIINPAALHCAFCRRAPAAKTLAAYGMGIHAVRDLGKAVKEKGAWIHAWCLTCSAAKRHMERSCARGAPPEVNDFVCEECVEAEYERLRLEEEAARRALLALQHANDAEARDAERRLRATARQRVALERPVKECPRCKVPTQKALGCDHLSCICGAHWCWACGKQFDSAKIYGHMNKVHGGYYAGGDYEYDSDGW